MVPEHPRGKRGETQKQKNSGNAATRDQMRILNVISRDGKRDATQLAAVSLIFAVQLKGEESEGSRSLTWLTIPMMLKKAK